MTPAEPPEWEGHTDDPTLDQHGDTDATRGAAAALDAFLDWSDRDDEVEP